MFEKFEIFLFNFMIALGLCTVILMLFAMFPIISYEVSEMIIRAQIVILVIAFFVGTVQVLYLNYQIYLLKKQEIDRVIELVDRAIVKKILDDE